MARTLIFIITIFTCMLSEAKIIDVSAGDFTLLLQVDKTGNVFQLHLGEKRTNIAEPTGPNEAVKKEEVTYNYVFDAKKSELIYPTVTSNSEYQFWEEPALHAIHSDGRISTLLKYENSSQSTQEDGSILTSIKLKDPLYPFFVTVHYLSFPEQNVIQTWTEISHNESAAVQLQKYASGVFTAPEGDCWLTHFSGAWAKEFTFSEVPLTPGSKVIENKWGIWNSHGQQPHFILSIDGKSQENSGRVIMGTLAWSGNHKLQFEKSYKGKLVVSAGINPWSGNYSLEPGKVFETPKLILTWSDHGKGQASRNLHRWALKFGIRDGSTPLRTLFNNWEATGMDTSDSRIIPFLSRAKDLGFELFLLDDGWFGTTEKARILGEWEPSPKMHPQGMSVIINECKKVGIDFGIWVEYEMANEGAILMTKHPDWLLVDKDRPKFLQRGQYVLDLSNPEVQEFCIRNFRKLIKDNPGISFIKWDSNSSFQNPYSSFLGKNQQHIWVDYVHGLNRVFAECVKAAPNLQMMLCSAGGGRVDYDSMKYFHEFWPSDNTNPLSRVFIQWGYSHFFPAKTHGAHVTNMGHMPFKFAFDVAMSGTLGMDADPTKMTAEQQAITKRCVAVYKEKLRPIVQLGDLYRLLSPYENSRAASVFVSPESGNAVAFIYQVQDDEQTLFLTLQGLDAQRTYTVTEVNIDSDTTALCSEHKQTVSGENLMKKGIQFNGKKKLDSSTIYLEAQK